MTYSAALMLTARLHINVRHFACPRRKTVAARYCKSARVVAPCTASAWALSMPAKCVL